MYFEVFENGGTKKQNVIRKGKKNNLPPPPPPIVQAADSLASRTLRAWRERSDLQAARKAVFRARYCR